jgi:hypothetical protein
MLEVLPHESILSESTNNFSHPEKRICVFSTETIDISASWETSYGRGAEVDMKEPGYFLRYDAPNLERRWRCTAHD